MNLVVIQSCFVANSILSANQLPPSAPVVKLAKNFSLLTKPCAHVFCAAGPTNPLPDAHVFNSPAGILQRFAGLKRVLQLNNRL